ncbi:MAG TPA: outer membrane beta-barrel family protein [Flavobacterium sp.]|nr:outer membrane beta-barrel family protein [Flavobacterium sp.]
MRNLKSLFFLLLFTSITFAQGNPDRKKVKITGTIIEKTSRQPLEYATITFINTRNPKAIGGGITNAKGEFEVEIAAGMYTIKAEFISFKATEIKDKKLTEDTNIGTIALDEDAQQLSAVNVRAEKSTVEIKLDKKVYNVGQDLMVKGGTVSDVLDNIPSVAVDVEGNVTLRGNDNVKILIDGRPSNAINVSDALRLIPADALDKVEIVTNPSARYEAEGGGGIINILLKKGKNLGVNGTLIVSAGSPENTGVSTSFNIKSAESNIFGNLGYSKRNNPGNTKINQENFDGSRNLTSYVEERRRNQRANEGFNGNIGIELYLDKSSSWTHTLSMRNNDGENPEEVLYNNYYVDSVYSKTRRYNAVKSSSNNIEYATNYTKKFKKDGHKFTIDASFSKNLDNDSSTILGTNVVPVYNLISSEKTINDQTQNRNIIQADYVLPFGKGSQFEAGFRGGYSKLLTDYRVLEDTNFDGIFTTNFTFTNTLEYKENISAAYVNFGSKLGKKFSYLLGLRFEDSNIRINQYTSQDFNTKHYQNLFPSAFLNYEIAEGNNLTLSYSKRINRPRDRFINPFSSYSSNVNLFQGNPNLDPTLIDAFDIGYLKKWNKVTLSASLYHNRRKDAFQFVRYESGRFVNNIPIIINSPFNLGNSYNTGLEITANYTPFKWWRLNGNVNFYNAETSGNFTYFKTDLATNAMVPTTIDFDNSATTWTARASSKFNLPAKIDLQLNGNYDAEQKTAQGKSKANASMNFALSKDILKDKATIAFNINDVFNSRKRINEVALPTVNSYSEMQWRQRQFTLSFTYRFNKQKNDRDKQPTRRDNSDQGGDEFGG